MQEQDLHNLPKACVSCKVMSDRTIRVGDTVIMVWYLDSHHQWRLHHVDDLYFDFEEGEHLPIAEELGLSFAFEFAC